MVDTSSAYNYFDVSKTSEQETTTTSDDSSADDLSTGTSTRDDGESDLRTSYVEGASQPTSSSSSSSSSSRRSSSSSSRSSSTSTSSGTSTRDDGETDLRTSYVEGASQPKSGISEFDVSGGRSRLEDNRIAPGRQYEVITTNVFGEEQTIVAEKRRETITMPSNINAPYIYTKDQLLKPGTLRESTKEERKGMRQEVLDDAARGLLNFDTEPTLKDVSLAPLLLARAGKEFVIGFAQNFNPLNLIDAFGGVVTSSASVITGESTIKREGQKLTVGVSQSFVDEPAKFIGGVSGPALVPRGLKALSRANVRRGTFVPPETLFETGQIVPLEQGRIPRFPTSRSTKDIVSAFEDVNLRFQTSSPQSIKGGEAKLVGKGLEGTEGGGISVTPEGTGSSAFLRLPADQVSGYSLNPLAGFKDVFKVPTVTRGKATGITKTPPKVTKVPGFQAENIFMTEQVAGTGQLVVPKRIQIGQGNIKPQTFKLPSGKKIKEFGTTELEAKIPLGQQFARSSPDQFTVIAGETVRVRNIDLLKSKPGSTTSSLPVKNKLISSEKLLSERSSMSNLGSNKVSVGFPSITTSSIPSSIKKGGSSISAVSTSNIQGSSNIIGSGRKLDSSPVPNLSPTKTSISNRDLNISPGSGGSSSTSSGDSDDSSSFVISDTDDSSGDDSGSSSNGSSGSSSSSISTTSPISKASSSSSIISPRKTTTSRNPLIFRDKKKSSREKETFQGYDAYAFQKGKDVKLNTKPLPKNKATNMMMSAVDNTSSATGMIKPSGKTSERDTGINILLRNKFRTTKQQIRSNKPIKFTEKNTYRIDTPGEIRGITAKGWKEQKKNKRNIL